jgi:2,4-diketo-3-deoxy-L-fuconate hydrolase
MPIVPLTPQEELRLGPCVSQTGIFVYVCMNYANDAAESGV